MNTISTIIPFHLPEDPYGCFSNWAPAPFSLARVHYVDSEQYMMSRKVLLARRHDLAQMIMDTTDPAKMQEYAGENYFDDYAKVKDIWEKTEKHIVKIGVRAKFAQNPAMLETLLGTGQALLAECAYKDVTWAIGISSKSGNWRDVSKWRGKNYLGIILMELREEFRQEIARFGSVSFTDYTYAEPNSVWNMKAGQLKRIPQYYDAIHTYAMQLPPGKIRNCFYYDFSLNDWDIAMQTNMGGGLPIIGFYEMKQEVYEIFRRLEE